MRVAVHIWDSQTDERGVYMPPFDYDDDEDASGGWECSNDMCDGNRLDHLADLVGRERQQDEGHVCGTGRVFVKIVELGTERVVYEEEEYTESKPPSPQAHTASP